MAKTAEKSSQTRLMPPFKTKRETKREQGKQCTTRGKDKNIYCQATPLDKAIAFYNRSYKLPEYQQWCERKKGRK